MITQLIHVGFSSFEMRRSHLRTSSLLTILDRIRPYISGQERGDRFSLRTSQMLLCVLLLAHRHGETEREREMAFWRLAVNTEIKHRRRKDEREEPVENGWAKSNI